jgi:hypothetical protein
MHRNNIPIYNQQDAKLDSLFYLETALHISGGVRHPQHTQTSFNSSTIDAGSNNSVTYTRCCRYSFMHSWWWVEYHPKNVEQFPDINKLCNVASCWIYIGILSNSVTHLVTPTIILYCVTGTYSHICGMWPKSQPLICVWVTPLCNSANQILYGWLSFSQCYGLWWSYRMHFHGYYAVSFITDIHQVLMVKTEFGF